MKASCQTFAKSLGRGFAPEKKNCFSPRLQLFLQNCFLDFFSDFHLFLEVTYLAPGTGFRFPGDGPFMSGWGVRWTGQGGEWKSQTRVSEDGSALGSQDVVYLSKILCL